MDFLSKLNAIIDNKTSNKKRKSPDDADADAEITFSDKHASFLSITTTETYEALKEMKFASNEERRQYQTDLEV